jgi:hypothetical protein
LTALFCSSQHTFSRSVALAAYACTFLACPICRSMMTVGNGEMIDNQAQTELLPPTSSYLRQRLSLQKGNFGYSSPLYLSAVPNTESGTMIKPLLYQWPSKICSLRENAQQMQPMPLPSLPKTTSAIPSEPKRASPKVMTDKHRDRMRAYADQHPLATQQNIAGAWTSEIDIGELC